MRAEGPTYDYDALRALREKAKRLLLRPLACEFQDDVSVYSVSSKLDEKTIIDFEHPSSSSLLWGEGLCGLEERLGNICSVSHHLDLEALASAFPLHSDKEWRRDARYCARGLLHYLVHEFLGVLFSQGKVICLAEDSSRYSFVTYGDLFSEFTGSYDPPEYEHDFWSPAGCDAEDLEQSGADALWYGFARDFSDAVPQTYSSWLQQAEQCPDWSSHPIMAPFIRQVVTLVVEQNLSAKAAAEQIVEKHGNSPKGRCYKKGTVVGAQPVNAAENLYKPANKILKKLRDKGSIPS